MMPFILKVSPFLSRRFSIFIFRDCAWILNRIRNPTINNRIQNDIGSGENILCRKFPFPNTKTSRNDSRSQYNKLKAMPSLTKLNLLADLFFVSFIPGGPFSLHETFDLTIRFKSIMTQIIIINQVDPYIPYI